MNNAKFVAMKSISPDSLHFDNDRLTGMLSDQPRHFGQPPLLLWGYGPKSHLDLRPVPNFNQTQLAICSPLNAICLIATDSESHPRSTPEEKKAS